MKHKWFTIIVGLLLSTGLAVMVLALGTVQGLRSARASSVTLAPVAQNQPAQSSAAQLAGNYSGAVKLNATVSGVYSDTLTLPPAPGAGTPTPPELGSIDLSLQLSQTSNALSGYVNLDKTLIFTIEHTLGSGAASLKIGPYVKGSFDGTNLVLQSERVAMVVSGRAVQRQFRLTGKLAKSDGSQISGEYRETLWGYASVPVTVIGTFTLQRPGLGSAAGATTNKAPVTVADRVSTAQNKVITINVLANDNDPNNDALQIASLSKPQFGTAVISGQSVLYTPKADFSGEDTFTYIVSDGQGGSTAGSVTVTVDAGNAPTPTAIAATPVPTPTPTAISPTATPIVQTPVPTATPIGETGATPTPTPIPGNNIFLPLINR